MRRPTGRQRLLILAAVLLAGLAARQCLHTPTPGEEAILEAFRDRRSGVVIEAEATVERLLADDLEGAPHQRMIVRLAGGHTLLIVHNIELAKRVPAAPGDPLEFRGQYEWNDRGGLVHWTHHDPGGRRPGGWLRHAGRTYR